QVDLEGEGGELLRLADGLGRDLRGARRGGEVAPAGGGVEGHPGSVPQGEDVGGGPAPRGAWLRPRGELGGGGAPPPPRPGRRRRDRARWPAGRGGGWRWGWRPRRSGRPARTPTRSPRRPGRPRSRRGGGSRGPLDREAMDDGDPLVEGRRVGGVLGVDEDA